MSKISQALQSRTFWTIAFIVAVNTVPQLKGLFSQAVIDWLNGVLGLTAVYFHVNPSQNY